MVIIVVGMVQGLTVPRVMVWVWLDHLVVVLPPLSLANL